MDLQSGVPFEHNGRSLVVKFAGTIGQFKLAIYENGKQLKTVVVLDNIANDSAALKAAVQDLIEKVKSGEIVFP